MDGERYSPPTGAKSGSAFIQQNRLRWKHLDWILIELNEQMDPDGFTMRGHCSTKAQGS